MSDIVEFLLARVAEDEAHAREAMGATDGEWSSWNRSWDAGARDLAAGGERIAALPTTIDEHVCRHDPARVLAECEAKRRIVELYRAAEAHTDMDTFLPEGADWILGRRWGAWCAARALAQPYADHPDFDPAWRIE